MANPWERDWSGASAAPWERDWGSAQPSEPKEKSGTLRRVAQDAAVGLAKGAVAVPQAVVGLADIATGGRVGKFLENEDGLIGFRPKAAQDELETWYTPETQAARKKVQEAEGFVGTAKAMLENPSSILTGGAESLPSMAAGGLIGRGVMAAVPRVAPMGAAAVGEGAVMAGQAAANIREQTADGLLTPEQAALAGATGVAGAAIARVGGAAANKLGIGDLDTAIVQGGAKGAAKRGIISRTLLGGAVEGGVEEMPQSMTEQALQNVALDRPVGERVAEAGAQGLITGAPFGMVGANIPAGPVARQGATTEAPGKEPTLDEQLTELEQSVDGFLASTTPTAQVIDSVTQAGSVDEAIEAATAAAGTVTDLARRTGAALAPLVDRQAELAAQAANAGTEAERQGAMEQAAVSLERNASAPRVADPANFADLAPMDLRTARGRLTVLRYQIAREGGDALSLAVVPHPNTPGRYAIGRNALPSLDMAAPAPAPAAPAEVQQRLETAALTGEVAQRQQGDQARQVVIDRALRSIEERGGVASPAEAQILAEANLGRPFDRVDPSLAPPLSMDEQLTQATGIALDRAPRESAVQTKAPSTEAAQEAAERQAFDRRANQQRSDARMASTAAARALGQQSRDMANQQAQAAPAPAEVNLFALESILKKSPALRNAQEVAILQEARRTLTPEQMSLVERAVTNPPSLSATDRLQLRRMREGDLKFSQQRDPVSEKRKPEGEQAAEQQDPGNSETTRKYTHEESVEVDPASLPAQARAQEGQLSSEKHRFLKALSRLFGKKLVVFQSAREDAPDGYVRPGDARTIYINVRSQQAHLVVFGHELLHQIKATSPKAYEAIRSVIKLRAGADLNVAGINGDMEEVTADLVGNLFADTTFWREVFGRLTRPEAVRLGDVISRVVDRFKRALDGMQGFDTGNMVENLDQVRVAAVGALAQYAREQAGQAQPRPAKADSRFANPENRPAVEEPAPAAAGARRSMGDRFSAKRDTDERQPAAAAGGQQSRVVSPGGDAPRYGTAQQDSLPAVSAWHFSQQSRPVLSSAAYGQGLKGSGREQFLNAADPRSRQRIYFYVDKGDGINPEAGVGGAAHEVILENLYDFDADPRRLKRGNDWQAFETAVMDAGFDGYLYREHNLSAAAVLLGQRTVRVAYRGVGREATKPGAGVRVQDSKTVAWETNAFGPVAAMEAKAARMRENKSWSDYDIRVTPAVNGFARVETRKKLPVLNVGLSTAEVAGGGQITEDDVRQALQRAGVTVADLEIQQSDTEQTAVVTVSRELTPEEGDQLSRELQQEAIAMRRPDGTGELFGPQAANWGPFNPEFFVLPGGERAAGPAQPEVTEVAFDDFAALQDNASGESAASLEAQSRVRQERELGRQRALWDKASGLRPIFGVDGVDQRVRSGQILLQRGVGASEWTVLDRGPGTTAGDVARAMDAAMRQPVRASAKRQDLFPEDFADRSTAVATGRVVSSRGDTALGGNVNSRGQVIAETKQALTNFWRWFGNSDVVDSEGRPIVLYHSTNADVAAFKTGVRTTNNYGLLGDVEVSRAGVFLTPDLEFSQEYLRSGAGQNVMPLYARIENPLDLRTGLSVGDEAELEKAGVNTRYINSVQNYWELFDNEDDGSNAFVDGLRRAGYDGAIFREDSPSGASAGGATYVAFSPNQVKSATGNRGTYDGSDDIRQSAKRVTQTPEFKRWFGDSKVVDENGEPLVVYTGTSADKDFSKFKGPKNGIWFAADPAVASDYAVENDSKGLRYDGSRYVEVNNAPRVMPVHLALQNPKVYEAWPDSLRNASNYKRAQGLLWENLRAQGHDGVIGPGGTYVAFKPEQIKSAIGNDGTFDAEDPDIRSSAKRNNFGKTIDSTWSMSPDSKKDQFLYKAQDKFIDLKRLTEAVQGERGRLGDELKVHDKEALFHGRAAKRTKDFLDFEVMPMLREMREAGVDLEKFETFLHNRHAPERNRQVASLQGGMPDGGSGIKTADALAYMASLPTAELQLYEQFAERIDAIGKGTRDYLVAEGLEKQEVVTAWEDAYKHYVPLNRVEFEAIEGNGTGMGYSVRSATSRRAMGSDKPVGNIIGNLVRQREAAITRAEKNRIGKSLFALFAKHPNPEFALPVAPTFFDRDVNDIAAALIDLGMDTADAMNIAQEEKQRRVEGNKITWKVNPALRGHDNVLALRVNGEDHYVFFNKMDPRAMRLARSLKNLDVPALGGLMKMLGAGTRWLSMVNTQYNPVFGIFNFMRDFGGALVNLSSTPLAGAQGAVMRDALPALWGILIDLRAHRGGKKPTSSWAQDFEEFQREGGQTGFRDLFASPGGRQTNIKLAMDPSSWVDTDLGRFFTAGGRLKAPFEMVRKAAVAGKLPAAFGYLSDYNEAIENSLRLAAYREAKRRGMSKQEAAVLAKNLTVNFNRKGQIATQAGALYGFFNAATQGTARLVETLQGPAGKRVLAGGLLLGVLQALVLAAAGFDDEEPPEFVRDRGFLIPTGDGKYISVPLPLGLHVLPATARRVTEFAGRGFKDPAGFIGGLLGLYADAFNPIGGGDDVVAAITPSVFDPAVALARNKDWTGRPIAKQDFSSLNPTPGHTRARDTATAWSTAIAEFLNWSTGGTDFKPGLFSPTPDQIDYLIGQAFGGVAREASKVGATASAVASGQDLPTYKMPLIGRLIGNTNEAAAERGRYYNTLRELNMHEAEIKGRRESGQGATVAEYLRDNPDALLISAARDAERDVRALQKRKRGLVERGAAPETVRLLEERIARRMKQLNDRARALREAA